jgi:hypothetical protein
VASRTTFQLLGPTERDILEVLWRDGPRTIPQVVATTQQTLPIVYTTIKTITEALPTLALVTAAAVLLAFSSLATPKGHSALSNLVLMLGLGPIHGRICPDLSPFVAPVDPAP